MRILVTGRHGQVAQSLAERANTRHELVFAARPELDLADPASIARTVARTSPDLIVSAAGYTAVDKAEEERALAFEVNGRGPGVLAEQARRIGAPLVHLSTDYVFDGEGEHPFAESAPTGPLGVYGASKLAGELAVAEAGGSFVILRTSWVYSPFGHNFVRTMLRLASERDEIAVVNDQIGCPTSAFDLADALLQLADTWVAEPGRGHRAIYHLAGADALSWAELAEAVFVESGRRGGPTAEVVPIASSAYPTPAPRPANSRLDCGGFADMFGIRLPGWRSSLSPVVQRLLD